MITKKLLYELPKELSKPKTVKNFFPDDMFERVKQAVQNTKIGTDESKFHTMFARWESPIQFDADIEDFCIQKAKQIFNNESLKKTYFFVVKYQIKNGCIPHLWEHVDQNGTQTTIDITIENTADWGLIVEKEHFEQTANDAIVFCGQQHIHSRPPYPTRDTEKYTTVLFLHFTDPEHWAQKQTDGIYTYGIDGDVRFFNRNRFIALPDTPINQPICECHDYSKSLDLYDVIAGHAFDSQPEIADMTITGKSILAPGIIKYKVNNESARVLKGLIQNSMFAQWELAEVLVDGDKTGINYEARKCFNYFITEKQFSCHPQDPIRRLAESLKIGIDAVVEDFRGTYSIVPLESHHTVLLRYEEGNKFHNHIDDHPLFPRVVSVSLFLNDDFQGGELEFKEFNLRIKPETGDIIVFSSSFPYMHQVHPVQFGIRYAVVKWYKYK